MQPEKEALMSLPTKVRFAHRAAYRAMVLLLALVTPVLALFVTSVFIPFTFIPYNEEFTKNVKPSMEYDRMMDMVKRRVETIFVLPLVGSLLVTILVLIHICIIFKHGETVLTTILYSSFYVLWTIGLAIWCGLLTLDLAKYPNDRIGIADPLGGAYIHVMKERLAMRQSFNSSDVFHDRHQCCGILGVDDFSTDNTFSIHSRGGDYSSYFPSEYNETHMEVVPKTCCRIRHPNCHLKPKGQEWNKHGMYKKGCLDVLHLPLLAQVEWMTILSSTAACVALISVVIMLVDVRNYNKRKTRIEKKRSGFIAPQ